LEKKEAIIAYMLYVNSEKTKALLLLILNIQLSVLLYNYEELCCWDVR